MTGQTIQVSGGLSIIYADRARLTRRDRTFGDTRTMDFEIPADIQDTLDQLDAFIEAEIKPLEQQDDNIRFFDHRREWARPTSTTTGSPGPMGGAPPRDAPARGRRRLVAPCTPARVRRTGRQQPEDGDHPRAPGPQGAGLHNDLQNESSIVSNFPTVLMIRDFGTEQQKADWMPGFLDGTRRLAFGLTEPNHGSDATYMETTAVRDGDEWVINGMKRWNSGLHHATHDIIFARTSGDPGSPKGISAFLVPTDAPGFEVDFFWWTFNMPTDHAEVSLTDVRVGADALFGEVDRGLELAQHFVHENRIRQAASSLGAAQYCIDEAVAYANSRTTWGKNCRSTRASSSRSSSSTPRRRCCANWSIHRVDARPEAPHGGHAPRGDVNYRANRLACDAADRAMQTCGGVGYSRHMPFEHIYRHHRRYRITEGSEEIQMRKVGHHLFGFGRK